MFVSEIKEVKNFKNLSGLNFKFDEEINFLVGENNVGKTNVMELLNCLLRKGKFYEEHFDDTKKEISVKFTISYNKDELGFFENNFDIDDEYSLTIIATQEDIYSRIEYKHASPADTYINPITIKKINFIYYSSLRNPSKEIDFSKNTGTGKVLNYLVENILEERDIENLDLINISDVNEIVDDLNKKIYKINGLKGEVIEAFVDDDEQNIVSRILEVGDNTGKSLNELGDGLQYSFNIFLYILDLLIKLKTNKKEEKFNNILINDDEGNRYLPIVIALDEPEIHQHPYRQRALIKGIKRIIDNKNEDFIKLLEELFEIDGLIGQVFVVTHSPNILLNNYKQITRLYKVNDKVNVKCGRNIDFNDKTHKHLIRSFMYIKEAMFSKAVVLVEGDTEFGALPVLIERIGYDIDEESIGIIKLDGAGSVLRCMKLYDAYDIRAIAIIDKDQEEKYKNEDGIFFTNEIDFEAEIYNSFDFNDYLLYQKEADKITPFINYLKKEMEEFSPRLFIEAPEEYEVPEEVKNRIMLNYQEEEIKQLRNKKNALNGSLLAKYVTNVPEVFKDIIEELMNGVEDNEE
ncbi:ATP-dependent nuclease [Halanaerobacter jeridensis]|uniref:ATP-dependent endonuclease of OLD family n=1 Tax=Halanaerobacter jeridensis TaxID=706427 RepID=A0A938XRH0_9FIRM|nr:AAA family ATPase [Halanaerobacter jeridensis]MBM7556306.1 putative ATP-dependent endonuclease of OLD family [Halanaerobacter jeridensis]